MDADAAIGQSMEFLTKFNSKNRLITLPLIFADPGKPEKQKRDSHIYPFDYLVMEVIGDTNCESIKNQSEVRKRLTMSGKINSMKQRVNILHD